MGTYFRNFFIMIVTFFGVVFLYRKRLQKRGPLIRVLVFHDVQDADWFKKVLTYIQKKYHVITPDDFIQGRFNQERINVLITCDDGYASWVDVCLPILSEKKIRAFFFINSGLVDIFENVDAQKQYVQKRLLLSSRKTLSWEGVQKLKVAGHTIGGHTVNHVRLALAPEDVQKKEIQNDRERIRVMLGEAPLTFAYPFGRFSDYTHVTEKILVDSGYTHAFTTEGVFACTVNRYTISRLCIEDNMTTTHLGYWVEGGYDLYQKIKSLCVR